MSRRHLTELEMKQALGRGKAVAQLLGGETREPFGPIVRWITLHLDADERHVVELHEVSDFGSDAFADIGELPSIHGDDVLAATFPGFEAALAHAVETLGAARDRFVNESVIDDEYADLRRTR